MGVSFPLIPMHCSSPFCLPAIGLPSVKTMLPLIWNEKRFQHLPLQISQGHRPWPSLLCPSFAPPLLFSGEGDWDPSARAAVLGGHPWGCSQHLTPGDAHREDEPLSLGKQR